MPTIYRFDAANVWTGESRDISDMDGAPPDWTFVAPPIVPNGKFAYMAFPGWIIVDVYPPGPLTPIAEPAILEAITEPVVI